MATKFPLGFYGGNPNEVSAEGNAFFEANYNAYTDLMGARPVTMDGFVDHSIDPGLWAANAQFTAGSWSRTGDSYVGPGSGTTPVIGVPMASNAGGWYNVDDFYKAIANRTYDSDYRGVVDAWADNGYKVLDLRLGYEFNANFMPWGLGNSSSPDVVSDFIKAWQHLADIVHDEARNDGVTVNTVWNPADIQWSSTSTMNLYPGNQYVDIIGTDSYNPIYTNGLVNWQAGNSAATDWSQADNAQDWIANANNREHYWTFTNANPWNGTGQGSGWSIQQAIQLAQLTGKPLGISETGASGADLGNSNGDAPFPSWLASVLSQPDHPDIAFVNIWAIDQPDGGWGFLNGEQPAEAAAWAASFGAGSSDNASGPAVAAAPLTINADDVAQSVGSGPDALTLLVSEDAYLGDAQFTIAIDGVQVGGVLTATADHGSGQDRTFVAKGSWGSGAHAVSIDFLNDAYAGSAATDRNLYVDQVSYNGIRNTLPLALYSAGSQGVAVGVEGVPTMQFVDDHGAMLRQAVVVAGVSNTYAGPLDGNVHQWFDGQTHWATTDSFAALVTDMTLKDGVGGSYGVSNFEEANIALSGSDAGSLEVSGAAGGNIRLSSGNYNANITAMAANGDTAARNTFDISVGSGSNDVLLDASRGWGGTKINLQLGPGTDRMSFIWAGETTVQGGPGQAVVSILGGNNDVYAAGGSLEINASAGSTAYHFASGDGLLTIDNFNPSAGDLIWLDPKLHDGMGQVADGQGGLMVYFGIETVGIHLAGVTSLDPASIHWTS